MATLKKAQKRNSLRYAEYYDLTAIFDKLYADSKAGKIFTNLVEIISSRDNILLAYRELKRNKGSMTAGTDKLNIRDIEKIPTENFVRIVQKKLNWYAPRPVKRVEIPKDNGKTRPLGIPSIWDRIVQQCYPQTAWRRFVHSESFNAGRYEALHCGIYGQQNLAVCGSIWKMCSNRKTS